MRVTTYSSFRALPRSYAALFEQGATSSFCLTRWWFENLAGAIIAPPGRLCLIAAEEDSPGAAPLALLPSCVSASSRLIGQSQMLSSLSNYYSMVYAPLIAERAEPAKVLAAMLWNLRQQRPRCTSFRFQPLDPASPAFDALLRGLRQAGLSVQPFFHLGNWYESTEGLTSREYLARRPTVLRNTLRRKETRSVEEAAHVEIVTGGDILDRAIADYEWVYGRSWKPAEPYPGVIRELARRCASERALRLGLLYLNGKPVAAQIWVLWNRKATLYKLAHDREFDYLSPGTVLTLRMIERVIDVDRAAEIDFGVGDDSYKRHWLSQRRELWGIAAFDTKTVRGALGALRHVGANKLKRVVARSTATAFEL